MGGSGSRWVAVDDRGAEVARGTAPGASGLVHDPAVRATFEAALAAIRAALPDSVSSAQLGITGAGFVPQPGIAAAIGTVLGLGDDRFGYENDMLLAWRAVFGDGAGHLVSAGTGSVGVSVDRAGAATVVGGRGTLIDDAGSAAWIALRALDALYRRIDAHGEPAGAEGLAAALFGAMGGDDRETMRRVVYGEGRGRIGLLAVPVADAARLGDTVALGIMVQAGKELARLARVLLGRCGPAPVAFIGGALRLHPAIRAEIEASLAGLTPQFPQIDAAAHAALMAWRRWGP